MLRHPTTAYVRCPIQTTFLFCSPCLYGRESGVRLFVLIPEYKIPQFSFLAVTLGVVVVLKSCTGKPVTITTGPIRQWRTGTRIRWMMRITMILSKRPRQRIQTFNIVRLYGTQINLMSYKWINKQRKKGCLETIICGQNKQTVWKSFRFFSRLCV